ncbi:MAG: T9SS type A sorting domain-containing protein, partial [Bacteroidota bacterium]
FKNLTVNNAAGMTINQNVTVDGNLTMTAGTIATGSNTVTLGSSAVLTESAGNYIVGNLTASRTVGTGASTFGGIGVSVDAGTDDLGTVTVTRVSGTSGIVTNPSNGAKTGIARKWSVSSDTPPSAGRNITFSWLQDDDNAKDLTTAQLWKSTDNGLSWSAIGSPADVSGSRSISVATTSFSDWTVSDASNMLPVELTSFTARSKNGAVELSWSTATEVNNAGFEIEKNAGGHWTSVGFVDGAGTTNAPRAYSFVERNVDAAVYAYRLKQIDRDGNFEYSQQVEVIVTGLPAALALNGNYPNPFNPSTTISFTVPSEGRAVVKVYDISGKEVAMVFNAVAQSGKQYSVPFVAASLPSGIYFSQLEFGGKSIVKKMLLMK